MLNKNLKFYHSAIWGLILCLSSCARENCDCLLVAPYPKAGEKVAAELDSLCRPRERCAETGKWLERLHRANLANSVY